MSPEADAPYGHGDDPLRTVDLNDLVSMDFPPREMMLAPWLPAAGLALLFSKRGLGKTHLALETACAVATGGRLLGWHAPRARRVLIIDGEMRASMLQDRLRAVVGRSKEGTPPPGQVRLLAADLCPRGFPDLATLQGQAELAPLIGDADLIIIDNLSTVCEAATRMRLRAGA